MSDRDPNELEQIDLHQLHAVTGGQAQKPLVWANPAFIDYGAAGHGNAPTAGELKLAKQFGSVFTPGSGGHPGSWMSTTEADQIRSSFRAARSNMVRVRRAFGH